MAALCADNPGEGFDDALNPSEWVASVLNPFKIYIEWNGTTRVERRRLWFALMELPVPDKSFRNLNWCNIGIVKPEAGRAFNFRFQRQ